MAAWCAPASPSLRTPRDRAGDARRPVPQRRASARAHARGRARELAARARVGHPRARGAGLSQRCHARLPREALLAFARAAGVPLAEVDLERADGAGLAPPASALTVAALVTRRAGKPIAWNALRRRAHGTLALFVDADVSFAPDAFALLLGALAASPQAALASAKTTCAPRAGL